MWADAQRDGRRAEYRWRPLRKFRNSIPCTMLQSLADPAAGVPCSNAANVERKTWTVGRKVNFARGEIPSGSKSPPYMAYQPRDGQTSCKCGWPPVNDVAAVTKPRRETRWNLLGCPKLANRSQPLMGRSSSYCGDTWRKYCCLTSFFGCQYMP